MTCNYELWKTYENEIFFALQRNEHDKFGTKEHGMKTPGSDLRVSGITFLVRGDQTPPLLGSDTFCLKMESRFELRGRCQLSLWTTTLTKNSQHLAAARSALGSLGTDSDLAYGFWSACDTSRSSVSTSCRVQKANETCCIPCTNTRRTHQSRFGSTLVVGAMRWRWITSQNTTVILNSSLTRSTITPTNAHPALSPSAFPSTGRSTRHWWSKLTPFCSRFEGSSRAALPRCADLFFLTSLMFWKMGTAMLWIEAFVQEWNARKKAAVSWLTCAWRWADSSGNAFSQ